MQQVDKNGTKTILRLNEVVSKRRKSNSTSSSPNFRIKDSSVVVVASSPSSSSSSTSSTVNSVNQASNAKIMSTTTINDICHLSTTSQMKAVASPALAVGALQHSASGLEASSPVAAHPQHSIAIFTVQDKRLQFLVEFTAGALGGALSRTAYVQLSLSLFLFISVID